MTSRTDVNGRAERLLELQQLDKGWLDGTGEVISPVSVALARDLLEDLAAAGLPAPGVFPMENGCVQLEWMDLGNDESWEVVIGESEMVDVDWMVFGKGNGSTVERALTVDEDAVDERFVHVSEVVGYYKEREATR